MRLLKLIWDFRGPSASKVAEHHLKHLKEYAKIHSLEATLFGTEDLSQAHSIAFMVVNESHMTLLRDALKPHRGQLYTP